MTTYTPNMPRNCAEPAQTKTVFHQVEEKAGVEFASIGAARSLSDATLVRLHGLLHDSDPPDTSVVVFGSLARGEYTEGSDLDWTLLIDGRADEGHYSAARAITDTLDRQGFVAPGPTGVFGNVAFSHPVLHQIGGQEDTNKLTTQRILLLLESRAIGRTEAHDRVLGLVLTRYVEDDRGLLYGSKRNIVPRFLLNDIVRYWRTITVDFVYKQRERSTGWALRNAKLRMSRKLIFLSGLATCFAFELFGDGRRFVGDDGRVSVPHLVTFLRERLRIQPLEHLAMLALRPKVTPATARALFEAYDAFLGTLADREKRDHLKSLSFDDLGNDALFRETSRMGHRFQEALDTLVFEEDKDLGLLVRQYGVF